MRRNRRTKQIIVTDREPGLPYSKGLMASEVMVSGLSPYRSYQVAERIEKRLLERGVTSITSDRLRTLAEKVLREEAGERYAKNFVRWQQVAALDVPLVILIGGATGVGKSTIATQIAARLGIVRVVATDAIREVMRALFSRELMPTLYTSSFDADGALLEPPIRSADKVIVGFREQTAAVVAGMHPLLERASVEGTSLVVEGAHIVPGFVETQRFVDRALVVPLVVTVDDEDLHKSHFFARSADAVARPFDRYLEHFANIRRIHRYIKSQALSHGWPIVPNFNLDQALATVVDLVVDRASERVGEDAPETATVIDLEEGKVG